MTLEQFRQRLNKCSGNIEIRRARSSADNGKGYYMVYDTEILDVVKTKPMTLKEVEDSVADREKIYRIARAAGLIQAQKNKADPYFK